MPQRHLRSPGLESSKSPQLADINEVAPIPLSLSEDGTEAQDDLWIPTQSTSLRLLTRSLPTLNSIQKYSSISFTVFTFVHGTAVLGAPVLSTSLADELISMGRTFYQAPRIEEFLVWGSLGAHVISGILARVIKGWIYRARHGERKKHQRKRRQRQSSLSPNAGALETDLDGNVQVVNDEALGLTGGISGYAAAAPKKSFIYRKIGLTPLQFSGYLCIPLVLFHAIQVRVIPLKVDGDSSYVSLEYVSYLFSRGQALWKPLLNWVVYPTLITISTYHTLYGVLTWLRVKDLRIRKMTMNAISLISLWGMWSLYKVSNMEADLPKFITQRFDNYLKYFYVGF